MIQEKLNLVPHLPGCYLMKNEIGTIIYVGKAKDLKNRLNSYFHSSHTGKTAKLVSEIRDFEYIVVSSETESLILELNLIKKHDPKYNILLRDDKSYPYIELTNEKFPKVRMIRNTKRKKIKNHLYGPFPNATAARKTVNIINRLYPLRKCERLGKDLCLYYHIHECLGYCKKNITEAEIDNMKKEIIAFLKGDSSIVTERIKSEMEKASLSMNYERALELRDMLNDIDTTLKKQKIDLNNNESFDLINYYQDKNYLSIEIFFIRDGLLFGRHNEIIQTLDNTEDEVLEYLIKFYDKGVIIPKTLYIPQELDDSLLAEYFNVKVFKPQKGKMKELMNLALDNAKEQMELQEETLKKDNDERLKAIEELRNLLGVDKVSRMETFDNSHLFGTFYVGGMVVFDDFIPLKDEYRKYKISALVKDDLGAMKEVLYRRYYKVLMENLVKPDLIVMDGGVTQIGVCKEIISSLGLNIPIIGLVKDGNHRTSHIMNQDYEILDVPKESNLFLFLTRIQDEVHRYAITYHRNIKAKGTLASVLDLAPGIGEVRRKELLKKFGSLKKIKEASVEELSKVLPNDVAQSLVSYLKEM